MTWSNALSHPIHLRSGNELATLADADNFLQGKDFAAVRLEGTFAHTRDLLAKAADSDDATDIELATQQVRRFLLSRHRL
jgi:hypothetical protein